MRVTTKGQVTIPQELREKVGITPGSEVEFKLDGDRLYVVKTAGSSRGRDWANRMRGKGCGVMSTDEIMELTRGRD